LPLVASADVSLGTLEVHGEDDFHLLCLRAPGDEQPDCGDVESGGIRVGGDLDGAITSFVVDGTWYVGAASSAAAPEVRSQDYPPETTYPSEAGSDGPWRLVLATPPADVDTVAVMAGDGVQAVERPG